MTSDATLHISPLTPTDADELLTFIRQVQRDDPLRPVTVVAPSNYALLSLRHRLGRSGFANVQFMVFPRLAELLGAPSLSAQGRRPLTSIFDSAVVRDVASEVKGILEPLRDHPSTHLSLRQTFRQTAPRDRCSPRQPCRTGRTARRDSRAIPQIPRAHTRLLR